MLDNNDLLNTDSENDISRTDNNPPQSSSPLCYVGIGASAGGLEALEQFFSNTPATTEMGYIVVQHLSPDYKSMMVELLQRYTEMRVLRSEDGQLVEKNCVYLIPPGKNLTIRNGILKLSEQDTIRGLNLPIDIFFRSLATDQQNKAIGIILSGTGSDGSLGVKAIKNLGGLVLAQDVRTAKFDGMPKSAIAATNVDFILPPALMANELIRYAGRVISSTTIFEDEKDSINEHSIGNILEILKNQIGVDFNHYKSNTLIRRIERRMSINHIDSIPDYIDFLLQSAHEVKILYKEMLIGVTQFFRDEEAFLKLKEDIIPKILNRALAEKSQIRIWSVGCSSGEEAYSLAILFKEYMRAENINNIELKIFATDLDKSAIEQASSGIYPPGISTFVTQERLSQFFIEKENGNYQIIDAIRRLVVFAPHNIIKDPPFSKIDLLVCRNLLIYFKAEVQKKVLSLFQFSLRENSYMFLGSSESIGELTDVFKPISTKWKIYTFNSQSRSLLVKDFLISNSKSIRNYRIPAETLLHKETEKVASENIYDVLLEATLPPSVLIDAQFNIIQIFNNINDYITIPSGKLSLNLLKLVKHDLAVLLGNLLHMLRKEKTEVNYKNFRLNDDGEKLITISAKRLVINKFNDIYILVSFNQEVPGTQTSQHFIDEDVNEQYHQRLQELEQELKIREESLQTTLEEMETSNEELQATNEELIASNEELQSTNEELQSLNEELYTVNTEFHQKIEELTSLNNDINNLLKNTRIGTLFLDNHLHIRKFTEGVARFINLMDIDVGRPISHISHTSNYPDFIADIIQVQETLIAKEKELLDDAGHWHLIRILPFRTPENNVDGVIITIIDITNQKKAQQDLLRERDLFNRIMNNSPLGKIVLNKEGLFTYMNKKAEEILETSISLGANAIYRNEIYALENMDGSNLRTSQLPFNTIVTTKTDIRNFEHIIKWPDGRRKYVSLNGSPIFSEDGEITGAILSIEDRTPLYTNELSMVSEISLLQQTLNYWPYPKLVVTKNEMILIRNEYLQLSNIYLHDTLHNFLKSINFSHFEQESTFEKRVDELLQANSTLTIINEKSNDMLVVTPFDMQRGMEKAFDISLILNSGSETKT